MPMPLIPITLAWLVGIWLASRLTLPLAVLGAASLVSLAAALLLRRHPAGRWSFVLISALVLGAARYQLAQPRFDASALAAYNDQSPTVTIDGIVSTEPDVRDSYTYLRVQAGHLTIGEGPARTVRGLVLVQAPPFSDFRYGDRVQASGKLQTPTDFGDFAYRDYLARQGVYSVMYRPRLSVLARDEGLAPLAGLYAFKANAKHVISQILPEPQASLLTGILLGDDSGLPKSTQEAFRATGTSHVIAISGYNVTILVGLMSLVAVRLVGRRRAFYILALGLLVYMLLVGASASVVRAVIMGILYLLAARVGRTSAALNTLFVTALLMTVLDPMWLWDVGFLLSFAATLGLILYATPIQHAVEVWLSRLVPIDRAGPVLDLLSDALLVTLAAQITTLPILVYTFKQFSLVSLLTNALLLPAQPGVMLAGGFALATGLAWLPLGQILGWFAWLFLAWTTGVVEWTARIPGASWKLGEFSIGWVVAYYALLGAATWWLKQPAGQRPSPRAAACWIAAHLTRRTVLAGLGLATILVAVALLQLPDGNLHVYFLDVGQGDAILIVTPQGRQILVDGGPAPSVILAQLARRMPFWDRSLDLLVATQPDADHLAGLVAVLERYTISGVLADEWPGRARDSTNAHWSELISNHGLVRVVPRAGLRLQIEPGLELEVLHPDGAAAASLQGNDASLVARLVYKNTCFLFTADVQASGEDRLLRSGRLTSCTVLKAAHHGARTSTSAAFLAQADPLLVVISAGAGNPYGHPAPETLARLAGRTVVRTDLLGTIELTTDGTRLWFTAER